MKSAPHRRNGAKTNRSKSAGIVLNIPRASKLTGGFPEMIRTSLRYCDVFSLAATTTANARVYGGNCLWDPYLAVGGHQPANFDNWTRIYGFYTVVKTVARLRWFPDTTSSAQPAGFGLSLSYDGALVSNYPSLVSLLEQPQTKFGTTSVGIVNSPRPQPVVWEQDVGGWVGGSEDEILTNPLYKGTSSANPPTIAPYFEAWQASLAGSSTGANTYLIELEFDVVWSNPLPALPS